METTILNNQPTKDTAVLHTPTSQNELLNEPGTHEVTRSPSFPIFTVILSVVTILMSVRYLIWRISVNQWHLWWLSGPLLAAELFTAFHILGYQYTVWPRKIRPLQLTDTASNLPIYIFIPTVNEGREIIVPTIEGAIRAREKYLHYFPATIVKIVICNDGRVANVREWKDVEEIANTYNIDCITRTTPGGAKAGNIENARRAYGANGRCLLAVLDADQVAEPDFLVRAVAPFADPTIGWVQTRQFYRNTNIAISRWAEHQATLFYDLVCPGKSAINASYICGTNVVIRAQVLDDIGGFPTESVTEDFAASIRTHQRWRSIYIRDILARGIGPLDITGYFVQQSRWARGTMGVLRSDWKRLLLPGKAGLNFDQRVQYLLSGTHYLCGLRDLTFLATALTSLYLSDSPIKSVSVATIAYYLVPYIAASQLLILIQVRSSSTISGTVVGYISFPTLVMSTIEALFNRRMRFRVTPKSDSGRSDLPAIIPHIFVALICLFVVAHAFASGTALHRADILPLLWVLYALCLLAPTFFLARLSNK